MPEQATKPKRVRPQFVGFPTRDARVGYFIGKNATDYANKNRMPLKTVRAARLIAEKRGDRIIGLSDLMIAAGAAAGEILGNAEVERLRRRIARNRHQANSRAKQNGGTPTPKPKKPKAKPKSEHVAASRAQKRAAKRNGQRRQDRRAPVAVSHEAPSAPKPRTRRAVRTDRRPVPGTGIVIEL